MAQKDVGNKVPIYKLKETKEVMDFYDEWGQDNKYDQDMVDWNYTCLLYTSPSPRDQRGSRLPSSA